MQPRTSLPLLQAGVAGKGLEHQPPGCDAAVQLRAALSSSEACRRPAGKVSLEIALRIYSDKNIFPAFTLLVLEIMVLKPHPFLKTVGRISMQRLGRSRTFLIAVLFQDLSRVALF